MKTAFLDILWNMTLIYKIENQFPCGINQDNVGFEFYSVILSNLTTCQMGPSLGTMLIIVKEVV